MLTLLLNAVFLSIILNHHWRLFTKFNLLKEVNMQLKSEAPAKGEKISEAKQQQWLIANEADDLNGSCSL